MPFDMPKCKITVLKRTLNKDLADEYLDADDFGACQRFSDGQEFVVNSPFEIPEGFGCPWAWADIRNDIVAIMTGGGFPWMKQPGTTIAGCTDWFRPVIFKIERLEE
jgi:uncharacterized repeat protein (TIGR04076 family)